MKLKQTVLTLGAIFGISTMLVAGMPVTHQAYAKDEPLKCAVLPQSVCNNAKNGDLEQSGIWALLITVLSILTAGVGITAVAFIGYAGFLYASAQDSAEQTKEAKDMIRNTIIGIIMYGLMFTVLNFLIPGGVFSS